MQQFVLDLDFFQYRHGLLLAPARFLEQYKGKSPRSIIIVGVLAGATLLLVLILVLCCCCFARRRRARRRKPHDPLDPFDVTEPDLAAMPDDDVEAQRRDSVPWGHPPSARTLTDAD
eukprot:TRINITY_DN539_c0_g1_i3.p2 TRINITY_DN539_c0_g1~~TRINITY_DN539_c0_g1_i3.p2  ORF type:complete len:117 (-),score=12.95 TRINITY_DN539_c0_g1_i3:1033-1383(-)